MSAFAPTTRDLQSWRLLCKHARRASANPTGPGGDLRAAAKSTFRSVAPSAEALKTLCVPLRRLAEAWPAMNDAARRENAATLLWLAEGLGPLVGETRRQGYATHRNRLGLHVPREEVPPVETPEAREPRRDIFG